MQQYNVAVVGLWHLGCTTAACLSELGCSVTGIDFDKQTVKNLVLNKAPLFEPDLDDLIKKNAEERRLIFTNDFRSGLDGKNVIVIAYDTPVNEKDEPDMSVIYKACEKISKFAETSSIIIIMSQVPVGNCRLLKKFLLKNRPDFDCKIIYNPENLMLGQAIKKFIEPDRVIIGLENDSVKEFAEDFYKNIGGVKVFMDLESAEMVKHATNSFLATSISFINEISDICEKVGADARKVVEGLKADGRIGQRAFLSPGIGYAGGTLGRDIAVLQKTAKAKKINLKLIKAVRDVNNARQEKIVKKLETVLKILKNKKIAILGLTYKPGTSTLRRSMALELAAKLCLLGCKISAYDPKVSSLPKNSPKIKLSSDPYSATKGVDAVVLATDWPEFKELDFAKIKKSTKKAFVVDCKNFLIVENVVKNNLSYFGVGFNIEQ